MLLDDHVPDRRSSHGDDTDDLHDHLMAKINQRLASAAKPARSVTRGNRSRVSTVGEVTSNPDQTDDCRGSVDISGEAGLSSDDDSSLSSSGGECQETISRTPSSHGKRQSRRVSPQSRASHNRRGDKKMAPSQKLHLSPAGQRHLQEYLDASKRRKSAAIKESAPIQSSYTLRSRTVDTSLVDDQSHSSDDNYAAARKPSWVAMDTEEESNDSDAFLSQDLFADSQPTTAMSSKTAPTNTHLTVPDSLPI